MLNTIGMNTQDAIRLRFLAVKHLLDKRSLRLFVASEAKAFGYGGIVAVSKSTGFAKSAIDRGLKDSDQTALPKEDIRRRRVPTHQCHET